MEDMFDQCYKSKRILFVNLVQHGMYYLHFTTKAKIILNNGIFVFNTSQILRDYASII